MPTSGNLNSGDSLFSIPPRPPPEISMITFPLPPLPPYMRYKTITIRVCDCNGEIIFVSDKLRAKMLQKPNCESKEIRILGENGINSKLKHRKAHNSILSGRFGDSYGRRVLSYPGDLACRIITLDNLLFLTVRCKRNHLHWNRNYM